MVDVRSREEATGVLGYIPGSTFTDAQNIEELTREHPRRPLVLVSSNGDEAATLAHRLERSGVPYVAAMAGGLAAWRSLGLATSRDPGGIRASNDSSADQSGQVGPLTLDRVRQHIGDPRSVCWIKLSSMIAQGRLSCIDGRDRRGVVGTPGGDGGEFLLALAAIEEVTGKKLDEGAVAAGLLSRLDDFGQFYMHTDVPAFAKLIVRLQADPQVRAAASSVTGPEDWFEFLRHPPPALRETLLAYLTDPSHIGCGHIRLMLQHSDEYGTRSELVRYFLRAAIRMWWEGSPEIALTVLPGAHQEAAVVNVRLTEDIWSLSRIPLISPECGAQQMFINHPDVTSVLRQGLVQWSARRSGPLSVERSLENKLRSTIDQLAARQMAATVGYLAKDLPIFQVVFSGDGQFRVESVSA
jgi:rhodanese-related sulfurtransferase